MTHRLSATGHRMSSVSACLVNRLVTLTARDLPVLQGVTGGLTNCQIAAVLLRWAKTVKTHVSGLPGKPSGSCPGRAQPGRGPTTLPGRPRLQHGGGDMSRPWVVVLGPGRHPLLHRTGGPHARRRPPPHDQPYCCYRAALVGGDHDRAQGQLPGLDPYQPTGCDRVDRAADTTTISVTANDAGGASAAGCRQLEL